MVVPNVDLRYNKRVNKFIDLAQSLEINKIRSSYRPDGTGFFFLRLMREELKKMKTEEIKKEEEEKRI